MYFIKLPVIKLSKSKFPYVSGKQRQICVYSLLTFAWVAQMEFLAPMNSLTTFRKVWDFLIFSVFGLLDMRLANKTLLG